MNEFKIRDKEGNKRNTNTNSLKGSSLIKNIILIVLFLILITIGIVCYFVYSKIALMQHESVNESDLAITQSDISKSTGLLSFIGVEEVKTIALFGTDSRDTENMSDGRADSIMIVSINTVNKSIKLISIPRDTYVEIPGHGKDKINHSYVYGKEQLLLKTINKNFGLSITEYATIDFSGLINIINDVGGIEVEITKEEMEYINGRCYEEYAITGNAKTKLTNFGKVNLNGEQALAHSRNRTVGNDFVRASRQRSVFESLIKKVSNQNIMKTLDISNSFFKQIKTNISFGDCVNPIRSFVFNKDKYLSNILSAQIPSKEYSKDKMIGGVYYFTTDYDKAKKEFNSYLYEK